MPHQDDVARVLEITNRLIAAPSVPADLRRYVSLYQRLVQNPRYGAEAATFLLAQIPRDGSALAFPISPFLVAVHTLALEGKAPEVARFLPVAGGRWPERQEEFDAEAEAYARAALDHKAEIIELMRRGVQSNPVSRAGRLYPVELLAAEETRLPVRVLSLGAAAGADLRAHGYRYQFDGAEYGDPLASTVLSDIWTCAPQGEPQVHRFLERAEQRLRVVEDGLLGCDLAPIDLATASGRNLRRAYFAQDPAGHANLAAISDAARIPARIDEESALTWLPRQLSRDRRGTATIVWSSWMEDYLTPEERVRLRSHVRAAGQAATVEQPLYYARYTTRTLNSPNSKHRLELSSWNGQGYRRLRTTASFKQDTLNLGHLIAKAQRLPHRQAPSG